MLKKSRKVRDQGMEGRTDQRQEGGSTDRWKDTKGRKGWKKG